jgi:ribosomal protein L11 methylase PrmA
VVANITSEPVIALLGRIREAGGRGPAVSRVVVSGILAGAQEDEVLRAALGARMCAAHRLYEDEWVSLDLRPDEAACRGATEAAGSA